MTESAPTIALVAGEPHELAYWCRYNLEEGWDGVVVEISSDGGTTWTQLYTRTQPTGAWTRLEFLA